MVPNMRNTIKKHSDFIMPETCLVAKTVFFIAKANKTKFPNDARFGLIATKKTFPLATQRNRAKRLLRAWLNETEYLLNPEKDYVFIARSSILSADKSTGINSLKKALSELI